MFVAKVWGENGAYAYTYRVNGGANIIFEEYAPNMDGYRSASFVLMLNAGDSVEILPSNTVSCTPGGCSFDLEFSGFRIY